MEIDADGDGKFETVGSPGDLFPIFYARAGSYIAAARIDAEPVGGIKILVQDADLDGPIACELSYRREKEVSPLTAEEGSKIVFTAADPEAFEVAIEPRSATPTTLYLKPLATGTPLLQARLNHKFGPVIAREKVDVFTLEVGATKYARVVDTFQDESSLLVELDLAMEPLISDLEIRMHCFSSGATFENSDVDKVLTTDQFDEEGKTTYRMIITTDKGCHWLSVYQRDIRVSATY